MSWLIHEWRLLQRSPLSIVAILLLLVLTSMAVWSGLQEVERQHQKIEHLAPLHEQDVAAISAQYADAGDVGYPAYYTFHYTWDEPSDTAFLALGLRDAAPYVLRVRALGLQAQLYEGEVFNPELALSGRFDFAFVLIYLVPLFVIALLHDLISVERQSGRLGLLLSLPDGTRIWRRRVALRYGLLLSCLLVPMLIGAAIAGMALTTVGMVVLIVASYLAFWVGLTLIVTARGWRSVTNATALMGTWVMLTLVLPTLANVALVRTIPVHQGVDLMLAQRQIVHGAWEIPREETMQRFIANHPEWKDTAPLSKGFQWKWYFAFHQLGDDSVAEQAKQYRDGLLKRQAWTDRIGWILPSVGAQVALHQFASTDLPAQLRYQDQIADYHKQVRMHYYPYLFNDLKYSSADFDTRPIFEPEPHTTGSIHLHTWIMLILCWIIAGLGIRSISSI
ncbi:DUF3526 domain-containing protein [Acinetobacter baumannii]|uniref:DUF3526 domain-containing protein n=1 Tax=Acinetobacter baumannii TaxID=470 RepID=UPI000DD07537|nr:DUF3526 domain-containing protein [Acinetobacter baumannii]HDU8210603.1 DUF3526 domain-containing protein [Acinetobacter baumannii]